MTITLSQFHVIRPEYELDQEKTLEWVAAAHGVSAQDKSVGASMLRLLKKIGLGRGKMSQRGVSLKDCLHENWDEMEVYSAATHQAGAGFGVRTAVFDRIATGILARFYPQASPLPSHLIHVTCTGYVAPSPAQKLVSLRGAGQRTIVTHAYHMGCYAAIPALRMAPNGVRESVDIVHTEVCSLHFNPSLHSLEQLVVQSLFADGFIKYSISGEGSPGFELLATQEELVSDSIDVMSWSCDDWGMKMTLSIQVPALIVKALPSFVSKLLRKGGVAEKSRVYFAIHPGGSKIIEQVAGILQLEPWQWSHTAAVFNRFGNMSSATLPHIWASMWDDPLVKQNSMIVSLAYGPGLTLAGAVFQCKR